MTANDATRGRTRNAGLSDRNALSFNPVDIGNLQLWYKGSDFNSFSDADRISPLHDYSGNTGRNAIALVAVTYKTAIKNGLAILRASSSSCTISINLGSGSFTFVVAADMANANAIQYIFDCATGRLIIAQGVSGDQTKVGWYDGSWRSIAAATTGWQILTWVLTSGGNGEMFRNGSSLGTAAYTAKAIGGSTRIFSTNGSSTVTTNCDLGDFLLYNKALNATELADIHGYLNGKWGIY